MEFPDSQIIYINPPDFFEPVSNTEKIILPSHDTREFSFETQRHWFLQSFFAFTGACCDGCGLDG